MTDSQGLQGRGSEGEISSYFPGDAPELRELLDTYLAGLGERLERAEFAGEVAFLLLAGGYGRGEGGVFVEDTGRRSLYNDLEFYLVMKSTAGWDAARRWCEEESHSGEHETGIEVEFKILGLAALRDAEPSMFYYDLLAAHRLVFGDAGLLARLPERLKDGARIPAYEAARLLFNRGSGLFYSRYQMGEQAGVDTAFVERNHAKARLAFADAVLAMNGKYVWSCRVRHERLAEPLERRPGNFEQLVAWHEAAVDFKFHPRHEGLGIEELIERQRQIEAAWTALFLWVESLRLGRQFHSPQEYAAYRGRLFPEFPLLRNIALHLRDRLRRGGGPGSWMDYPRAPLQRALGLLLQGDAPNLEAVRSLLGLPGEATQREIYERYRQWWSFYN